MFKALSKNDRIQVWEKYKNAPKKTKAEITLFKISAYPDTNEGRFGPTPQGYVLVRGEKGFRKLLLENFLCEVYGPPLTFGMGNYLVENWSYKIERFSVEDFPILYLSELIAVIESPDLASLTENFIWLEWNCFTKQFFSLKQMLKQKKRDEETTGIPGGFYFFEIKNIPPQSEI